MKIKSSVAKDDKESNTRIEEMAWAILATEISEAGLRHQSNQIPRICDTVRGYVFALRQRTTAQNVAP